MACTNAHMLLRILNVWEIIIMSPPYLSHYSIKDGGVQNTDQIRMHLCREATLNLLTSQ